MTTNNVIDSAVQGSVRPALSIVWADSDDVAIDLTNASMTGTIRSIATGFIRAIMGDLVITNAASGTFRWDLDPLDVAEYGRFLVQFEAVFSVGATPAKSEPAEWRVIESQVVGG